jgi:hypothetical protein
MDDNGRIYLYSGFSPMRNFRVLLKMMKRDIDGSFCVELEPDMLTIKREPVTVAPGPLLAKGTGFEGHTFFEASSMRKVSGRYYFIYSSELSHELCYAASDRPDGEPYVFDGRVYIYGSHDHINGKGFCLNDYVCRSAPIDDLGNRRYEGVK